MDEELLNACENGNFEKVQKLLKDGADPNTNSGWPLINACIKGYTKIAKLLIDKEANTNVQDGMPLIFIKKLR